MARGFGDRLVLCDRCCGSGLTDVTARELWDGSRVNKCRDCGRVYAVSKYFGTGWFRLEQYNAAVAVSVCGRYQGLFKDNMFWQMERSMADDESD